MKHLSLGVAVVMSVAAFAANAETVSVVVPGTSDMWLAGMPDGSTATSGDSAPAHSPVLVPGLDLSVEYLTFATTGGVSHTGSCTETNCSDPDGDEFWDHSPGALNGLSATRAPIDSMMGVFLDSDQPDSTPAPDGVNFEEFGLDFESFQPSLKQVFFIGDGLTGRGEGDTQLFFIPDGAERLYLGSMDAFGWFNNNGAFNVDVSEVPLPPAVWLFGSAVAALGWCSRKRRT